MQTEALHLDVRVGCSLVLTKCPLGIGVGAALGVDCELMQNARSVTPSHFRDLEARFFAHQNHLHVCVGCVFA